VRLVYLAPSDIQVARVDRQCIVSFCSALARLGVEVELVAIGIRLVHEQLHPKDPLSLYRIRDRFRVRVVRVPVSQTSGRRWIALNRLAVHIVTAARALWAAPLDSPLVFYTKTYSTACALLALQRLAPRRADVVFEVHLPPRNAMQRLVLRSANRIVANSGALADELLEDRHFELGHVLATHQGVDLDLFENARVSKGEARARLGLPEDKTLVVYTGKVYRGYEEVEYILQAARMLEPRDEMHFVIVGGRPDHVARFRERAIAERRSNVTFAGFVAPADVQTWQLAADVLVLYYPSGFELNRYRSPGKLFEYMASERPIVAVDLPVLREILEDDAACFVEPDDPERLARAISGLLDDERRAVAMATHARRRVEQFTWEARARLVLEFIGRQPTVERAPFEQVAG
jgi:glycosyltransferase involved in cell wall biosynthesis